MRQFKFQTIKEGEERETVFTSISVKEIKLIFNALLIDAQSDGLPDPEKVALLERLRKLIPE